MSETTAELVVLLDDDGNPIGTADKATVHHSKTPLHLAFSAHIFNAEGKVLVTRRALGKKTWPGVWTNSVCGHPGPGESMEEAIARRAAFEVGVELSDITIALPDFRYRAIDASGVVENEVCPVYTARAIGEPRPRDAEVSEWAWLEPKDFATAVRNAPVAFSPWLVSQLEQWPGDYAPAD